MRPTFAKNSTGGRRPAAGPMAGVRRTPTKASVAAAIRHAAHGLRFRARPDRLLHHRRPLLPDRAGHGARGRALTRPVAGEPRPLACHRQVEPAVIGRPIEVAPQPPTGSNSQGWHFVVVTDADKRAGLATVYRRAFQAACANARKSGSRRTSLRASRTVPWWGRRGGRRASQSSADRSASRT